MCAGVFHGFDGGLKLVITKVIAPGNLVCGELPDRAELRRTLRTTDFLHGWGFETAVGVRSAYPTQIVGTANSFTKNKSPPCLCTRRASVSQIGNAVASRAHDSVAVLRWFLRAFKNSL
jgi:hypothetical protein